MRKRSAHKKSKIIIPLKLITIILLCIFTFGYCAYYVLSVLSIKTVDKTLLSGSQRYLLSQGDDSSEKTLIILETGLGKERKISDVYLFLDNKEKEKSLLIYLPSWLYFTGLEENFGSAIPVSSFRYAGDTLQEDRGVEYCIWQLSQILGITFNNYIYLSSEAVGNMNDIFQINTGSIPKDMYVEMFETQEGVSLSEGFFKLPEISSRISFVKSFFRVKQMKGFSENIYSNLNFLRAMNLFNRMEKIFKKTEAYSIDLSYYKYSQEELSDSGGTKRYLNTSEFDKSYRSLISSLIDRSLEKERVRVEVYNGSGVTGAAGQFGRKIENSGCDVVRYENAPKVTEKTLIYVSNRESFPQSIKVVSQIFSDNFDLVDGRPGFMTTGDIVIILGQDIKQMYSF